MENLIEQWERESKSWQEIANNMKDHDKTLSERSQTRSETYHICAQQLKRAIKKQEDECKT